MSKKIATAIGSDNIYDYLVKNQYEVVSDISYQEGVLELVKKDFVDILIVYSKLSGEMDKYIFIDKLKQIDTKLKIIVIMDTEDENYKSFLWSKGIFDVFLDGKSSFDELERSINGVSYNAPELDLSGKSKLNLFGYSKNSKDPLKSNLTLKFQKQEIITFAGVGSAGKTTVATEFAKIL